MSRLNRGFAGATSAAIKAVSALIDRSCSFRYDRRVLHYIAGADQKLMVEPAVKVDADDHRDDHGGNRRDHRKQGGPSIKSTGRNHRSRPEITSTRLIAPSFALMQTTWLAPVPEQRRSVSRAQGVPYRTVTLLLT